MPNQRTRRDIPWSIALPTLEPCDYDRLSGAGVAVRPEDPIAVAIELLGVDTVAASVARSGALRYAVPLVTSVPALLLVATDRIETSSTRLANVLRRLGHEHWQHVMLLRVDEFMTLDGVGVETGYELVRSALAAGFEALWRATGVGIEEHSQTRIPFLDRMPTRLRATIQRIGAEANDGELTRAIARALVVSPDELRREPLGALFVGLDHVDSEIPLGRCAGSVSVALSARAWTRWAHTAGASVDDILAMPNVGQGKAADFLVLLGEAWLGNAHPGDGPGEEEALLAALRVVSAWARGEQQHEFLGSVLEVTLPQDVPADVTAAASQLASTDLGAIAGRMAERYSIRERVLALREELDDRELHILHVRVLTTGKAPTLEDVGVSFGLTRERVRQGGVPSPV